jgi:predicted amidohydrolase
VIQHEALGRLGLLIGTDSYVPEAGTIMAIQRADIVAVPASWHGEIAGDGAIAINSEINPHAKHNAMVLWDAMSWGQQFYTVVANISSNAEEPGGRSGIYSTDPIYGIESPAFALTDDNEVVAGTFQTLNGAHPDHWIDQSHYIGSRRPGSLYYPLVTPSSSSVPPGIQQPLHAPKQPVPAQLVP